MKHFFTTMALLLPTLIFAQNYATPGTGMSIDMDYLVENSGGVVTSPEPGIYNVYDSVTISLNDTLVISPPQNEYFSVRLDSAVLLTIEGGLRFYHSSFTKLGADPYNGILFGENSYVVIVGGTIEKGGGLRVLTGNFSMTGCTVQYHQPILSTGGAVSISTGSPQFYSCIFKENAGPAIASAANSIVSPYISGGNFIGNNTLNENRPQINLSTSGPDNTTYIVGCEFTGYEEHDRVGAISFADLLGVATGNIVLEGNTISNNRYGIYVYGNDMHAEIVGNTITDNNNETNPMAGGSGILIQGNDETTAYIAENTISGNLWGVNALGAPFVNLGDTAAATFNPGGNVFFDNGNGGVTYTFYNNTPNDQTAMNNCWNGDEELTPEEAEELIFHSVDNNTLGTVTYLPLGCISIGIEEPGKDLINTVYPNPASSKITVELDPEAVGQSIELRDVSGALVMRVQTQGNSRIAIPLSNVAAGIYFINIAGTVAPAQKVVVLR